MKNQLKPILLILFFSLFYGLASGQSNRQQTNSAILYLQVLDTDHKQIEKAEITIRGVRNDVKINLLTDSKGNAKAMLPLGQSYILDVGQILNADTVHIPDEKGFEMELNLVIGRRFATGTPTAEVVFRVNHPDGRPLEEKFIVFSLDNSKSYLVTTGADGTAMALLPAGGNYRVDFPGATNYFRFSLPAALNHRETLNISFTGSGPGKLHPTIDRMLVRIHYYDFENRGVPGEVIKIRGEGRGREFTVVTNDSGWVSLLLPKGERYVFSTQLLQDFQRMAAPPDEQLLERTLLINYISTKGYYEIMAEIEREERIRDSIYQARLKEIKLQDSITRAKGFIHKEYLARQQAVIKPRPVTKFMEPGDRKIALVDRAKDEEKAVENDFTYFEKQRQSVNAPLFRFRDKWRDNVVVVDVTCSMDPYVDQLMTWLAMKFSTKQKNRYVFFNDGDGIPVEEKYIGKTGGFHYTASANIEEVLAKVYHAESFGCSGDPPENDLEALLHATKYLNRGSQLVLVADNLSAVRDIELLPQLKVPVRVILCGLWVEGTIHPHYLEIAYHTGGSIHTISEDMMDLKKKVDKDQFVEINNRIYHFRYGKFVPGERIK